MNRPDEERDAAPRWIECKRSLTADQLRAATLPAD
jgi:hypothetical protein